MQSPRQSPREMSSNSYKPIATNAVETDAYHRMLKFMKPSHQHASFKDLYQSTAVVNALCLIVGISPAIVMDEMSVWKGTGYEDTATVTYNWLKALVCHLAVIGLGHSISMKMSLSSIPQDSAPRFMKNVERFAGRLFPSIATTLLTPTLLAMYISLRCSFLVPVSSFAGKACLILLLVIMYGLIFYFLTVSYMSSHHVYTKLEHRTSHGRISDLADALRERVGDEFTEKYLAKLACADITPGHLPRLELSHLLALDVSMGDALTFMASGQKP